MGTYFALMDETAKRGEDYETLDQIYDTLRKLESNTATSEEVSKVIEVLDSFHNRIAAMVNQPTAAEVVGEATGSKVSAALERLRSLKEAIESVARLSSSAART